MNISKRLLAIANKIKLNSSLIDVGTDHAYVPIYLYTNKIIDKAIAADISKGSCAKAILNICSYNLENNISVIQSDGLKSINTNGYNTLVISGMGGELISNILASGKEKLSNVEYIILQPQTEIEVVRKKLHNIGYMIVNEEMIYEDKKYYTIIVAQKGNETYEHEIEYLFGRINLEQLSEVFVNYLKLEIEKSKKVLTEIEKSNAKTADNRATQIHKYISLINDILQR